MNLGDIKVESLKLMFANDGRLTTANLGTLDNDPNYADYMCKMNGSIARAMKRIEELCKAPVKMSAPIEAVEENGVYTIDLSSILDRYKTRRIDRYLYGKVERGISYQQITNDVLQVACKGLYKVVYYPILPMYNDNTPNETEIPLKDNVASLIPFYVKSELLEEEESSMAVQARNLFEASLEEIDDEPIVNQRVVKRVV